MKYISISILIVCIFINGCQPNSHKQIQVKKSIESPIEITRWKSPRHMYSDHDNNLLVIQYVGNKDVINNKYAQFNKDKVYYFINNKHELRIFNDKTKSILLSVPSFKHRPLQAKWINTKLIYLEVYFNPHFGVYWLFDVEKEKVIISELENDGVQAYQQVHGSK